MGDLALLVPEFIHKTLQQVLIIRNRLQISYSWQKSYADQWRKDLEFEQGEKVYLKISLIKGVVRFGNKGKLNPRYVGP